MWTPEQARETYNVLQWGEGYFDVGADGHLEVRPRRGRGEGRIDLYALAGELRLMGLPLPVLLRFTDILRDRVDGLCEAFASARAAAGYRGRFTAVYPIKVNQQRRVVEEILRHGGARVGLEAGSKPELMAVLALSDPAGGVVVCNGYKDREYIRLALVGRDLGHRVYLVLEKLSELEQVLAAARDLGIRPLLGVRVRLASIGAGKWQNTGGEKAKFGLTAAQVLQVVARLEQEGLRESLQLVHFHMGSQIANIRDIQRGLHEGARYYAELRRLGVPIECVDIGGGLGVDYDGTRSRSYSSTNYSLSEYANNVVRILTEVCAASDLPHPDLITEAGRAMTAHHAVLLTNVIDIDSGLAAGPIAAAQEAESPVLRHLRAARARLTPRSALEVYHDAVHWLAEAQAMFNHGILSLAERALAEDLYRDICSGVRDALKPAHRAHRKLLDDSHERLADRYFCNFSLFQSVPDVWGIDQVFPILPLHRLDEPPTRRGVLEDITCDSDGRIDRFVDGEGVETSLPLHALRPGEPYLLGIFLVGAYQEILGDMHNLFGDTHSVHVELRPDGTHRLVEPLRGDSVDHVLRYVHFEPERLLASYREQLARQDLSAARCDRDLVELSGGLSGYTYLEE